MTQHSCWINLLLTWSGKRVLTSKPTRDADPAVTADDNPADVSFQIKETKFYVLVVTLSTEEDDNFLEQLKSGFKRNMKWNKYRSEMTNQNKTNNLNYLIDPTIDSKFKGQ